MTRLTRNSEDLEANDALDDADQSEITGMQEGTECEDGDRCFQVEQGDRLGQKVKNAGVEFAIIRVDTAALLQGIDRGSLFEKNIKGAIRAGFR